MKTKFLIGLCFLMIISCNNKRNSNAVVLQTDFGLKDGAVAAMKGVIMEVDPGLKVFDLTHEIPPYNIWEAAYRLAQTSPYWPAGTVFVSVVDPGVGTERKSVVLKTKSGQFFVTPDNGTLTMVTELLGVDEVREIDESINRRKGSGGSYTFHGRDIYAYTAARLASGTISFEQVGKKLTNSVVKISYQEPILQGDTLKGNIPILDIQYGNVWTNIGDSLVKKLHLNFDDSVNARIFYGDSLIYAARIPFVKTFGDVPEGRAMSYLNSLMNFSMAINMGNFSDSFHVKSGPKWRVALYK